MNTAVSLPDKNNDEATKIAMGYRWYLFEGDAEGRRADVMLLSEEEAKLVNHVLDHMIHMVDEGYSGCLWMRDDLGGFDSKEDAFKAYCKENPWVRSDDVCEEFIDMYKEEVENE